MKFANKMMLVPAGRSEPEFNELNTLDREMANILENKDLTSFEKINLYHQILQKNLAVESRLRQKSQQIKPFKKDDSVEKDTSDLNLKTEEFKKEEDTREWDDMDLSNIYKADEMETETKSTPPKLKLKSPSLSMKKKLDHLYKIHQEEDKNKNKKPSVTKRIVKVCTNNDWQSYDTYEPYLLRNNKPVKYSRYPSDLYLTEDPRKKVNSGYKRSAKNKLEHQSKTNDNND
jgi:hypothetical protein